MSLKQIIIDTKELGCPEFMLDIRVGLKNIAWTAGDQVFVTIKTKSKTAPREIPMFMKLMKYNILSATETTDAEGYYEYVVSPTHTAMPFIPEQNNAIPIVMVDAPSNRDAELLDKFNVLVDEFIVLLTSGYLPVFPCSFGKDSMTILHAGLEAFSRLLRDPSSSFDRQTPFVVIHIDTAIEVAPMAMFSHYAMKKLKDYCADSGINLELHHVQPPLHEQYVSLFVGARKLPSTPNMNSDCAVIMKVDQSERVQRALIEKYGYNRLVTCLGSRIDEGAKRAASIERHGSLHKTAQSIVQKNESGLQSCALIRHWSTEDVFQFLQRVGSSPAKPLACGTVIPSFMPSQRLLLAIYGQSAKDTCEINIGATEGKMGCGGKARNGCHQCFKAGRQDSSATAQNQFARWGRIQKNATKVRDWVYALAHDVKARTLHARAFDPVTNHAILQPNILNSRVLEKMFWYYTQLSFDDLQRSIAFKEHLRNGTLMEDEGYADIANDPSLDDATRAEHLEMYIEGASNQIINMVTLEHAVFLSAVWAMDGVKSLPFRPLAIYDAIFNKGKRIPYPTAGDVVIDNIPDALALPLSEPCVDLMSLWMRPHREWDILDNDLTDGCFEENIPNSLRVRVEYKPATDNLSVIAQGSPLVVGEQTVRMLKDKASEKTAIDGVIKFNAYLTYRKMTSIGQRVAEQPRARASVGQFTRRNTKVNRKTGRLDRGRTSLQMYIASTQSALSKSWMQDIEIWVPDHVRVRQPYMAQHDINDNETANYAIHQQSLHDWLETGGMEAALGVHDRAAKAARRQRRRYGSRFSMRIYSGTAPFWSIFQAGIITVSPATRHVCYQTVRRTEIFAEAGLFDFPDHADAFLAQDRCKTTREHRSFKAKVLLGIRKQRSEDRKATREILSRKMNNLEAFTVDSMIKRMNVVHGIREAVCGTMFMDAQLFTAMDASMSLSGPSTSDIAAICADWEASYGPAFRSAHAFIDAFGSSAERQLLRARGDLVLILDAHLRRITQAWVAECAQYARAWVLFFEDMQSIYASGSRDLVAAQQVVNTHAHTLPAVDDSFICHRLIGAERTFFGMLNDEPIYKKDAFFDAVWMRVHAALHAINTRILQVEKEASSLSSVATMTGKAKSRALLARIA